MERYSLDKKTVVMTREQVRAIDAWAINELGIPGVVLMENAGRSCAEFVEDKLADTAEPKVCIFCGAGNNGGDGYVIARHLINIGFSVTVVVCGDRTRIKGDAKINLDILDRMGFSVDQLNPAGDNVVARVEELAGGADMIVDSLFGTGLSGQIRDDYRQLIECINCSDSFWRWIFHPGWTATRAGRSALRLRPPGLSHLSPSRRASLARRLHNTPVRYSSHLSESPYLRSRRPG